MIGDLKRRSRKEAGARSPTLRTLTLTIDEGRNDVDTVANGFYLQKRELLSFTNPMHQRRSKRLSLVVVLTLIFFASVKVGIFTGNRLIDMYIKTDEGRPVGEKRIPGSRKFSNKFSTDSSLGEEVIDRPRSCDLNGFVRRFKPEELDIKCNNFAEIELGSFNGRGSTRQVFQASWRGNMVAIKEYFHDKPGRDTITQEASVLFHLRESENVVKLIGMCNSAMVLEYAPTELKDLVLDKKEEISVERALSLGLDVVRGLAQVHNISLIHGDIKLDNFLINPKGRVLLSDFDWTAYAGLNEYGEQCSKECPNFQWPSYRAPEVFLNKHASLDKKTDIYEVAMVLWSLLAREKPYTNMKGDSYERIIAGERPDLTLVSSYPQEMRDLIVAAWDGNPLKRPSATDLVKSMEEIMEKYFDGPLHQMV